MSGTDEDVQAAYVHAATLLVDTGSEDLSVDPPTVDVIVRRAAPPPGEEGWLYFRDNCWRGELTHPDHVAALLAEELGIPVESVSFRELRATGDYHEALRSAIARDLQAFNADDVDEVLSKYLGSSIHVVDSSAEV